VHDEYVDEGVLCFCELCLLDLKEKIFEVLMAVRVKVMVFFDVFCVVW
jgi:hypothetical protein